LKIILALPKNKQGGKKMEFVTINNNHYGINEYFGWFDSIFGVIINNNY